MLTSLGRASNCSRLTLPCRFHRNSQHTLSVHAIGICFSCVIYPFNFYWQVPTHSKIWEYITNHNRMHGDTKIRLKSWMPSTILPSILRLPACYLKYEDKSTKNYNLACYLICMWQMASCTRGRTHSEGVREWGARPILESTRVVVTGGWTKLHSEYLRNFSYSSNTIRKPKSRAMRWPGHVPCMGREDSALLALRGEIWIKETIWKTLELMWR